MRRIRSIALPITLALLVTGCYTQLRAPRAESYSSYEPYDDYADDVTSPSPTFVVAPHRHVPVPVFHHPHYDHHDWWLYGETHCDIWVTRYYDYHPWLPRHATTIVIGRPHHRHYRHNYRVWHRPPVVVRPRWRHRGPRFEPLSPTIEVEVEVVDRRKRFRRAGFAGGVPGRADDMVVTVSGTEVQGAESEVIRVRRPKLDRGLSNRGRDRRGDAVATLATDDVVTKRWSLPGKTVQPSSPAETAGKTVRQWKDPGRDVKGLGPATQVTETAAKQPKPQTNWFNPQTERDEVGERPKRRPRRSDQADGWRTRGTSEVGKDEPQRRDPDRGRENKPAVQKDRNRWTGSEKETEPKRVEKRPERSTRSWTAPKKVEKRGQSRKVTSRSPERSKSQVKKSTPPKKQRSVSKKEEEKNEEKKTQNRNKQDRSKKRKKSGRRGM